MIILLFLHQIHKQQYLKIYNNIENINLNNNQRKTSKSLRIFQLHLALIVFMTKYNICIDNNIF